MFNFLEDTKEIPESKIKEIFIQIVEGVKYIHEKNYYHGDLKLENIVIDKDGHVRIIDFGLANKAEQ